MTCEVSHRKLGKDQAENLGYPFEGGEGGEGGGGGGEVSLKFLCGQSNHRSFRLGLPRSGSSAGGRSSRPVFLVLGISCAFW